MTRSGMLLSAALLSLWWASITVAAEDTPGKSESTADAQSAARESSTPKREHARFAISPQASGPDYENHKSLLDGQPMNAKVHEYNDPPEHPSLWQRFKGRTRSLFSRARSALSPKQPTVTDSRFTMVGQLDATQPIPSTSAQANSAQPNGSTFRQWSKSSQ